MGYVEIINYLIIISQIVCGTFCLVMLISLVPVSSRKRQLTSMLWDWKKWVPNKKLLDLFNISSTKLQESNLYVLWSSCGFRISIESYVLARKLILIICYTSICIEMLLSCLPQVGISKSWLIAGCIQILLIGLLYCDQYFIRSYSQIRSVWVTKEIYVISGQLLYFSESKLNIHTKLRKCIPYSRLLRKDMEILLATWYHSPVEALQQFKQRIGTDDGISFVDTLDALRQDDNDQFYELLQARVQAYKEKLELAKEGRKETTSYVLYVVAGIPLLYTFQVFIYPWVQEVNKLLSVMH